jgi:hypothetical protein
MHDRLLKILLAQIEDVHYDENVWLWVTPKTGGWNISTTPSFDRRYDKILLVDRANAEKSISDFLYQQQPLHQNND